MRLALALSLLLSFPVFAQMTLETQVHEVDVTSEMGDYALVFLASGHVAKAELSRPEIIQELQRSKKDHDWFKFELDQDRVIQDVQAMAAPYNKEFAPQDAAFADYIPSIIPNLDEAKALFRDRRKPREGETQCFNRAMVWSYDWRLNKQVYSSKIWVFFTRKYVRQYNFEWWFHVAPMIHVNIDGKVKERVMDMKYSSAPRTSKEWTDIFLKDDYPCPTVTTYSDHANYPESGSCFIQKSSMYFYQPIDLEFLEKFGTRKDQWVLSDVKEAYREAFGLAR